MLTHQQLVNKIDECKYPIGKKGMCFGVAIMGAQAVMARDIQTFHRRIKLLEEIEKGKLHEAIEAAKKVQENLHEKVRVAIKNKYLDNPLSKAYYQELSDAFINEDKKLSIKESDLLSIDEFFQDLSLGYKPTNFPQLFGNKILPEQYSHILMSDSAPTLEKMEDRTLTMVLKYDVLTAYWVENETINSKSFKIAEVEAIYADLPKVGEYSSDVTLIEKIASKYGNTLPKCQDAALTFPKVLPKSLTQQKDGIEVPAISSLRKWSGLYNNNELKNYFELLTKNFTKHNLELPVTFLLASGNHTIMVSYEPDIQAWRVIDANQFILVDKPTNNLDKLSAWVMRAFFTNDSVPLATEVFCHHDSKEKTLLSLTTCQDDDVWKTMHKVTPEKAKLTDLHNYSWLMIAAKEDCIDVVKELVDHKADVNQKSNDESNPLIAAAQEDQVEIAKFLLEHKAEVDYSIQKKDKGIGTTALLSAVAKDNAEIVKLLIDSKADVNQPNYQDATPLFVAAEEGHIASLKVLLTKKPDIDKSTKDGYTPLCMAAQNGHLNTVEALSNESKSSIDKINNEGETPLFKAAQQGHIEVVKWLIEHGAAFKSARKDGIAPLHIAAYNGHSKVVELLLAYGEDVNITEPMTGATALYMAAQNGHLETVKILLEKKSDINHIIRDGSTPLQIAVKNNHVDVARFLLQRGADVNKTSIYGVTPLVMAVFITEDTNIIKLLLDTGADIYKPFRIPTRNSDCNALSDYSYIKNPELVRFLEPYHFINQLRTDNYNHLAILKLKKIYSSYQGLKESVKNFKELNEYLKNAITLMNKYKNSFYSNPTLDKIIADLDQSIHDSFYKFSLANNSQKEIESIETLKACIDKFLYVNSSLQPEQKLEYRWKQYRADLDLHKNKFKLCTTEMTLFDSRSTLKSTVPNDSQKTCENEQKNNRSLCIQN